MKLHVLNNFLEIKCTKGLSLSHYFIYLSEYSHIFDSVLMYDYGVLTWTPLGALPLLKYWPQWFLIHDCEPVCHPQ